MPRAGPNVPLLSADKPAPPPLLAKHDANRGPRLWNVAVTATKGLFNQPTRFVPPDNEPVSSCVPHVEDRRKRVRKSTSTPALKASASTGNLRRDMAETPSPPVPSLFTKRSFDQSPRKLKPKAAASSSAARRPAISSPSLPKPLDSLDSPHPKLACPLSPMPSPVGSTFSLKTPSLQTISQLPIPRSQSDDAASVNADACSDNRLVRRRTKSAPGAKFAKRSPFSPASPAVQQPETPPIDPRSSIVIDIASPSIASPDLAGSIPSPRLETPIMSSGYFSHKHSPLVQVASPRSFMSVKRKPVPRHLYTDPPEHDASTPCTPVLTPIPNSSPCTNGSFAVSRSENAGTLQPPLLPSSELILKACSPTRTNNRGLNLLPIGQTCTIGSLRKQHRRSVSEQGCRRLLNPDGLGLPSPWYTTNAYGSMTPLVTPAEEQAPFSFASDLPAAPRSPPQYPSQISTCVAEEISAFSDNTSVRSSICRSSGALSPLTDDEIDAIKNFLDRHPTGLRERQRRKANKFLKMHSRRTSIASCSYEMHTQIFESYATDEDAFSAAGSDDDADAESHEPMSASETRSTASLMEIQEPEYGDEDNNVAMDFDVDTPAIRDEIKTPIDTANRGTFGYCGTPVVRGSQFGTCVEASNDNVVDTHYTILGEWRAGENDLDEGLKSLSDNFNYGQVGDEAKATPVSAPQRSSSLYYRASSDYTCRSGYENEFPCLRGSCQPLVPRMLTSDSESDRPISSSTSSLSPSMSTGRSAFTSGIGLAIIPPEHFAYFDKFDKFGYVPSCSPSECGAVDDSEGSPTTAACTSPSLLTQRQCDVGSNSTFDGLQTDLSNSQTDPKATEHTRTPNNPDLASPVLKPALRINASRRVGVTMVQLPSPTDTIETYPPQIFLPEKGRRGQKLFTQGAERKGAVYVSADEAIPDNVKSFMNLTPDSPVPKRTRMKLRQLFSRANLRGAAVRKVSN